MAISRDSGPIPDPNLSFSPKAGEKLSLKMVPSLSMEKNITLNMVEK